MKFNILLTVVTIIICLLVAEVVVRQIYTYQPRSYECPAGGHPAYDRKNQCPTSQDRISKMQFSPDLLFTPQPNAKGRGWSHDKYGFRVSSGNRGQTATGTTLKIAITGGSTAWGVGVEDDQTIASWLYKYLAQECSNSSILVWNAGISAQTSGQERRRLESDILPLKPDIHIAVTGFNDVYNSYIGIYPHQNRDYFDVIKQFGLNSADDVIPSPPKIEDYRWRLEYLFASVFHKFSVGDKKVMAAIRRRALTPEITSEVVLRNARLQAQWAKRYGYKFYYALQPSIYLTDKALTPLEIETRDSDAEFGKFHSAGYQHLKKYFRDEKFQMIDLDQAIANTTSDLFIDNVHFGDRGYKIMAEYLGEKIVRDNSCRKSEFKK